MIVPDDLLEIDESPERYEHAERHPRQHMQQPEVMNGRLFENLFGEYVLERETYRSHESRDQPDDVERQLGQSGYKYSDHYRSQR